MRALLATLALASAASLMTLPARAAPDVQKVSSDSDRARDCAAGGRFSGYPDWARTAFTCGGS